MKNNILKELELEPTPSQAETAETVASFLASHSGRCSLVMRGYAGTGKTTLVRAIIRVLKELNQKAVLLAPTGRAAKVLGNSVGNHAYTIHKKIYRQQSSRDGFSAFELNKNFHKDTLFVVDEASMISNGEGGGIFGSGRLLDDLLEYVFSGRNCRVLLLGDDAQLPPVGLSHGPALDPDYISGYGVEVFAASLTDVVRQKIGSGILVNATHLRSLLDSEIDEVSYPQFRTYGFTDVIRLSGTDLPEELDSCY
ncbi:MAG: ATP-dependent DNA helicase, partial [Marinilabiliaceae bacterium]